MEKIPKKKLFKTLKQSFYYEWTLIKYVFFAELTFFDPPKVFDHHINKKFYQKTCLNPMLSSSSRLFNFMM